MNEMLFLAVFICGLYFAVLVTPTSVQIIVHLSVSYICCPLKIVVRIRLHGKNISREYIYLLIFHIISHVLDEEIDLILVSSILLFYFPQK
jgi:hypothetical protein